MNIFILDPNPIIAARYHCDQHLHKMILESAQMASSAVGFFPDLPDSIRRKIYKPAYLSHPCTMWVCESPANLAWVCILAKNLEYIRLKLGFNPHASSTVINLIHEWCDDNFGHSYTWENYTPFAEAMYARVKIRRDLNTVQKYQHYYRLKSKEWALTGRGPMTYDRRSTPDFMLTS